MKINAMLNILQTRKPNKIANDDLIRWLSTCDSDIFDNLIITHQDAPDEDFEGYDEFTDLNTELLVPSPYAEKLYLAYLSAQIDLSVGEMNKYNNDITLYEEAYSDYRNNYNRKHPHIAPKKRWY